MTDLRYMEDINNILYQGEVPNIFPIDEKQEIIENMRNLEKQLVMPNNQTLKSAARCRSVKKPVRNCYYSKIQNDNYVSNQMMCVCFEFFDL